MDIYELEANIDNCDNWDKEIDCPTQTQSLVIAKNELEIKYKERQEQIELLTKSLTSSCLLYTSPSPRDRTRSRMPSSA